MISPRLHFTFVIDQGESENDFSTQWEVPRKLPYFEGHFPENPILPAVAMIDASLELLRLSLGLEEVGLQTLKSAKFMSPIHPGQTLKIQVCPEGADAWRSTWTVLENAESAPIPAALLIFSIRRSL